ncbi:MAG: radical SAM protein [Candidatus Omnitrophica bacterium]|nr:radical SAM protein [Candidatus Omnitrophota bacterium]MBU1128244.1 radical SAM protein [Candidatus Omnitrophota bacterium]MBU1656726.1 radical SAM protein [Candidatus Omnitrophota bacterium]MBU1784411.1 radical SAM protein [Candidatus Omnitrophota bacterium]MBU1850924.1 radical SAM protein [Candidatus Omnitrophota bacterium]
MPAKIPRLLISDTRNNIYDLPFLEATGMKGGEHFRLDPSCLVKLPRDSELFMLPERMPVGYDGKEERYVCLDRNPFKKTNEPCFAVAAFVAPGYTSLFSASYKERKSAGLLPLFSYTAVTFYKGGFYAAGLKVDACRRQQLKGMDVRRVRKNIQTFRGIFPQNRLVRHLSTCALVYGCPAAKNFFLKRYEAPLPASPICNATCVGCISYQSSKSCSVTQSRITFVPSGEEIAEVALFHIKEVRDPVVSFGQGCEGEPLMVGDVLEKAIRLIRRSTKKGVINLNTNASKPDVIRRLFDAGLDSIRVSMNSVREPFYTSYYRPKGYGFKDVVSSITAAKKAGGFISINYLVMPGFTDSRSEVDAFLRFLGKGSVDMVQWRNLNYDPAAYFRKLKVKVTRADMTGMDIFVKRVEDEYPGIMKGYFNPSKGRRRREKIRHEANGKRYG